MVEQLSESGRKVGGDGLEGRDGLERKVNNDDPRSRVCNTLYEFISNKARGLAKIFFLHVRLVMT